MTRVGEPPVPEAYWVVPGRFLAGRYPAHIEDEQAAERLDALLAAGMDTFVDLTQPDELPSYVPLLRQRAHLRGLLINYERFPILDRGLPERTFMQRTLDTIDAALANGHNIYLHCWGGVGRTGTTVGCFLIRHGLTPTQALEQIAGWWQAVPMRRFYPRSPETDEQLQFIRDWHEDRVVGSE